ncbi:tetratricopeptide repeat protein [Planctomycetota bacterium]
MNDLNDLKEPFDAKTSPWVAMVLGAALATVAIIVAFTISSAVRELGVKRNYGRGMDGFYLDHWNDSLVELRTCMKRKPTFAPAYEMAAFIHYQNGEIREAEELYGEVVQNVGEKNTPVSLMGLAVIKAGKAAEKKKVKTLKKIAREVEAMKDEGVFELDALINAAAMRLNAGDVTQGRRLLRLLDDKEVVYSQAAFPVLANARGMLAYYEGKKEEAMKHFRYAASIAGKWQTPRANLSALSISTVSDTGTADEVIEKLFPDLHRTNTESFSKDDAYLYHNTLGVVSYMRLGEEKYGEAVANFNKAITVKPEEPWAKLNKAAIMTLHTKRVTDSKGKIEHIEATEKLYQEILDGKKKVDKKTRYLIHNVLGILAIKRDALDRALEHLGKAYEMRKDDYLVCRNLGILHYQMKNYAEARRFYGESKKLREGQEYVDKAVETLNAAPTIESATVRYTTDSRPAVGVQAGIHSCPQTVEDCKVEVSFGRYPAFFRVRPSYITCIPASDLEVGRHKLNVKITDAAGNTTSRVFDLSVDRNPPKFLGINPKPGKVVRGDNPTIVIKAVDELSAVDLGSVYVKYMTGQGMDMMISEEVIKNGRYQYDMPALEIKKGAALSSEEIKFVPKSSLPSGNYKLQIEGKDVVGNKAVPARWDFHIID